MAAAREIASAPVAGSAAETPGICGKDAGPASVCVETGCSVLNHVLIGIPAAGRDLTGMKDRISSLAEAPDSIPTKNRIKIPAEVPVSMAPAGDASRVMAPDSIPTTKTGKRIPPGGPVGLARVKGAGRGEVPVSDLAGPGMGLVPE